MPFADRELEARLLRETHELSERRLKLESAIRAVDAASKLHMEKAALRDIEAYRHLQRLHLSHAHEIRKLSGAHEPITMEVTIGFARADFELKARI